MEPIVYLNGTFLPEKDALISPLQPGFQFGCGLFETILVSSGRAVFEELHYKRLSDSAKALEIKSPPDRKQFSSYLMEIIKKNKITRGALRLTLTSTDFLIHQRPLPYSEDDYKEGFRAGHVSIKRNHYSPLAGHKTLNYMENILARGEARGRGWDEGLFMNMEGNLAEGTMSNIFLIKDNCLITPSEGQGLLPGVTRRVILRLAGELNINAMVRMVGAEEIHSADEAFLTNSLMGVMPLAAIDGRPVGTGRPGALTKRIRRQYMDLVNSVE